MKFTKLGNNKLQIVLTTDDFKQLNIEKEIIYEQSPAMEEFLVSLMQEAAAQTGVNFIGGQLMIEASQIEEAFVFIVTRIEKRRNKTFKQLFANPNSQRTIIPRLKYPKKDVDENQMLFHFLELSDLKGLLSKEPEFINNTSKLFKVGDQYYVITSIEDSMITKIAYLASEFGTTINNSFVSCSHMEEYNKVLAKGYTIFTAINYL